MADNRPAFLQNYQSRNLASTALQSIGSGAPPVLSIEGNRFALIDATGEPEPVGSHDPKIGVYVDVVIIDMNEHKSKIYYGEKKYDPNNIAPPLCFSDNGVAPSTQAGSPQSSTCASCQKNEIGSAIGFKGQGVRACRDYIKAAVVLPQYPEETFLLRIPPNSFKHLRTLSQFCEKNGTPLETLVVRVYFEQGVQGTLMFHAVSYIQEATLFANITGMLGSHATDVLVGRTDQPRQVTAISSVAMTPMIPPVMLPAPIQPNQPAFVTGTPNPQPMQMAPAPQQPAQQPAKRRRRTAAQIAADAQTPAQPAAPLQAPFQPQATAMTPPGQPTAATPAFGMANAPGPDPALMATLDSIFPKQ